MRVLSRGRDLDVEVPGQQKTMVAAPQDPRNPGNATDGPHRRKVWGFRTRRRGPQVECSSRTVRTLFTRCLFCSVKLGPPPGGHAGLDAPSQGDRMKPGVEASGRSWKIARQAWPAQ